MLFMLLKFVLSIVLGDQVFLRLLFIWIKNRWIFECGTRMWMESSILFNVNERAEKTGNIIQKDPWRFGWDCSMLSTEEGCFGLGWFFAESKEVNLSALNVCFWNFGRSAAGRTHKNDQIYHTPGHVMTHNCNWLGIWSMHWGCCNSLVSLSLI